MNYTFDKILALSHVFSLRREILSLTSIIKKYYPAYYDWAIQIDIGVNELFLIFLDEPTKGNLEKLSNFWFSTEPFVKKMITKMITDENLDFNSF